MYLEKGFLFWLKVQLKHEKGHDFCKVIKKKSPHDQTWNMKQDFMEFLAEKIICSASTCMSSSRYILCYVYLVVVLYHLWNSTRGLSNTALLLPCRMFNCSSCHVSNKVMSKCTLFVTTHPSPGPKKFEGKILFDLTVRTQSVLCYIT